MSRHCVLVYLALLIGLGSVSAGQAAGPKWWEQRERRADIHYPHDKHEHVMEERGDPCMMCHPFSGNRITDSKLLGAVNTIANEPLKAICHECHVAERSAPAECRLCHTDPSAIRPDSHKYSYASHHGVDARMDERACRSCHIDVSFCTDCHFRRDPAVQRVHVPGYRTWHGIDARSAAAGCGTCHNVSYCRDCHRGARR